MILIITALIMFTIGSLIYRFRFIVSDFYLKCYEKMFSCKFSNKLHDDIKQLFPQKQLFIFYSLGCTMFFTLGLNDLFHGLLNKSFVEGIFLLGFGLIFLFFVTPFVFSKAKYFADFQIEFEETVSKKIHKQCIRDFYYFVYRYFLPSFISIIATFQVIGAFELLLKSGIMWIG